ncbi:phosphatase PAP2 family protein [Anaeromyxobacter oryzae]|uniref:phosphatase PAP2 family protein n=1 Tax=Anaeromyxobacter oryzae TaxID=2918170 RepID=UPI0020BF1C12|nr:phosphatase PAP2 family protein [Anaeromyxobacter oryzae]
MIPATCLAAALAAAAIGAPPAVALGDEPRPSFGLGDGTRYDDRNVIARVLLDVVAIPADVPRWSAEDAIPLALVLDTSVALMVDDPSADVRLDRWISSEVDPHLPLVWNDVMQPVLWAGIAVGGFGTWWWAATHDRAYVAQGMSLMGEAVAVSQVYHLAVKFAVGREGPRDGDRTGRVHGPATAFRVYPAGTPSGHAATLYALLSAGTAYFEPPMWAQVGLHTLVGGVVVFHVIDHRHFLSESLLGSTLGWSVGRWVVLHRASPARDRRGPSLGVAPLPVAGATGVSLVGRF